MSSGLVQAKNVRSVRGDLALDALLLGKTVARLAVWHGGVTESFLVKDARVPAYGAENVELIEEGQRVSKKVNFQAWRGYATVRHRVADPFLARLSVLRVLGILELSLAVLCVSLWSSSTTEA